MEDTEWTDILKKRGIIADEPKVEENKPEVISDFDRKLNAIQTEDDLLDLDESDEQIIRQFRNQRIAEMRENALIARFGDVREITASDYVAEVNNAGQDIWVVLLLYQSGIPECSLLQTFISQLAPKYPKTKFLKSIASLCLANFPESSLPAIFVYQNGVLKKQLIGSQTFGGNDIKLKTVERLLSQIGALFGTDSDNETEIENKSKKFYEQFDD